MKTHLVKVRRTLATSLLALNLLWMCFNAPAVVQSATNVTASTADYQCVQRSPNSRVWQQTVAETNQSGVVRTNVHSYTELATGLCYMQNGEYADSVEEIDPVADGAQAIQGRHQVHWAANANTPGGAVNLTTPDGETLSSTVYALTYYDTSTGSNVLLAQLQDCTATIVGSNQLVYSNAFSNLTADVRYTYRLAGLNQDIILRQQPPSPADYGLNPASTLLGVMTEFFSPPDPEITTMTNDGVLDDCKLDWGDMAMKVGQAFLVQSNEDSMTGVSVLKSWTNIDNRTFLIEEVPYASISDLLSTLHSSVIKPDKSKVRRTVMLDPPKPRKVSAVKTPRTVKVAKVVATEPAFVLDYEVLTSDTVLLAANTTYYVSSLVNVGGTLTIEGSAVVKFGGSASAKIDVEGVDCETAEYRPAVFTSLNDNSVGDVISGSTGSPGIASAACLYISSYGTNEMLFKNLRFSYAKYGIYESIATPSGDSNVIWDCQFVNCQYGLYSPVVPSSVYPVYLYNVLFTGCSSALYGTNSSSAYLRVTANNVTADSVGTFLAQGGTHNVCNATNSIFTAVTNMSGVSLTSCSASSTSSGFYQPTVAGNYYLTNGSTNHGAGTTSVNSGLLADLRTKTTRPPTNFLGLFATNYTFTPQGLLDNTNSSTLDRGYHYDPVDFALNIFISNATAIATNGVVLAMYGSNYGVWLKSAGAFNCFGTATSPNYILRYNAVQEQSMTNWPTTNWEGSFVTPNGGSASSANFRFTDWLVMGGEGQFATSSNDDSIVGIQDCQFYGGAIYGDGPTLLVTNSLFLGVTLQLGDWGASSAISNSFFNNSFLDGTLLFSHNTSIETGIWTFRDNLFDQTLITVSNSSTSDVLSSNAFVGTISGTLLPTNGEVILSYSPTYQTGTLGDYYYSAGQTNLIYQGSRSAAAAGLYHYTVTTNNTIEGTNTVSIGFHYVACGTNLLPLVSNTNGVPDYLADANGNGLVDSGETPWVDLPTLIYQPSSLAACVGSNATFTAEATGIAPLLYQWSVGGTNIANATNASLTLTNVVATNSGSYTVVVTNLLGSATSSVAVLTVVSVASLSPTNNAACLLVSSNATSQSWTIPVSTNPAVSNLEVIAVSAPNPLPGSLPLGWSLDGAFTNIIYVSITNPAVYTVVCTVGLSSMTNILWVTPDGDGEQMCSTNGPDLLGYWNFDGSSPWTNNYGQQPVAEYGLQNPASPWGNALQVDTNIPANLTYNYIGTNGVENINCVNGAVSFWIKPDWNGGVGPGTNGQLVVLGNGTSSLWSLCVTNSSLLFKTGSNSVFTTYLTNSLSGFSTNTWNALTLDYSPSGTELYLNGLLAQSGPGITNYPDISDRIFYGFSIGSDHTGNEQACSCFDELYTFDCPLTAR